MSNQQSPSLAPPSQSDAKRMGKVLMIAGLIIFLLGIAAITIVVEIVGTHQPGYVAIDKQEMADAQRTVDEQQSLLQELQQEHQYVSGVIDRLRKNPGRLETQTPTSDPKVANSNSTVNAPSLSRDASDVVSRAFVTAFPLGRSGSLHYTRSLDSEQQRDFVRMCIQSLGTGIVNDNAVLAALQTLGTSEDRLVAARRLITNLDYFESKPFLLSGISTKLLLDTCQDFPAAERSAAILAIVQHTQKMEPPAKVSFAQQLALIPVAHRQGLEQLISHPDPDIQDFVTDELSADQTWKYTLAALQGNDFGAFAGSLRWIKRQPVDDDHRAGLLVALRPIVWVRDAQAKWIMDLYLRWADQGESESITSQFAKQIEDPDVIQSMIETVLRLKIPLSPILRDANGKAQQQLLNLYLQGDRTIGGAMQTFLSEKPPHASAIQWFSRIAADGSEPHLQDLEKVVAQTEKTQPDSVYVNQAKTLLKKMRARLVD